MCLFFSEFKRLTEELIDQEPLTVKQLFALSPDSMRYLIPYNKTNSRPYAILMYNPYERNGAEEEAKKLAKAWETVGFKVIVCKWLHTHEIKVILDKVLLASLANCCLLTINIMCHGDRGTLRGNRGSYLLINNLLYHLESTLPPHLPLVRYPSFFSQ